MARRLVQNGREKLHPVDESRAWAAEEGCRINDVEIRLLFASPPPCGTGWSDASELIDRPFDGVPARHYKDHIRASGLHGLPGRFMRWDVLRPKDIPATGQLNHFRNPM